MAFLDLFRSKKPAPIAESKEAPTPQAYTTGGVAYSGNGYANQVFAIPFDGEKDLGEMGQIRRYIIDHTRLRYRSWQLYIESDVCQALFKRSNMWEIGTGLKLEAEPVMELLNMEGVSFDSETFNNSIEARFRVFANSTMCDYEGKRNLHEIMSEARINIKVGGDVLLVIRLVNGMPKVKIIDGANVMTPLGFGSNNSIDTINPKTGNIIRYGIEINKKGQHVAYWVKKATLAVNVDDFERIPARLDKYPYSECARLIYGLKYRLENVRGIPLITAVMETASKMARYREATLGTAEELAKMTYQVKHEAYSSGDPINVSQAAKASGLYPADLPTDSLGRALANSFTATTNKQAFNNPPGASIEPVSPGDGEINFKDFYTVNFDIVCAVAGYPPEVIMSKYDSNYSASRAAIKDFEHTLEVERGSFAAQSYQIVYNYCLDVWVLMGKINAPGYLDALLTQDEMTLAAYRNATWQGDAVPHIDPFKEVQAIRAMLGEDSANLPLITFEDGVSKLGKGDFNAILGQYEREIKKAEELGIKLVEPKVTQGVQPNGNPKKKENDD